MLELHLGKLSYKRDHDWSPAEVGASVFSIMHERCRLKALLQRAPRFAKPRSLRLCYLAQYIIKVDTTLSSHSCNLYFLRKHHQGSYYLQFGSMEEKPRLSQLNPKKNEIRLLRILPQNSQRGREDKLHCEVRRRKLAKVEDRYVALSYTWSSEKSAHSINVQRKGVEIIEFKVRESLYQALWHIRDKYDPVNVWADAICIKQDNEEETSDQIGKMRQVYEMAQSVIVWLGPAADDSDAVIRGMKRLAAELHTEHPKEISISDEGLIGDLVSIECLSKFLARRWWSRVWVIQEVKVAKRVTFLCGHQYIDKCALATFLRLFYKLRRKSFEVTNFFETKALLQSAGKDPRPRLLLSHMIWNTQKHEQQWTLLRWLSDVCARHPEDSSQRMGAELPKDFIFALLALCARSESEVEPTWDYKMSCSDVYLKATEVMLKDNRMAVLSYAQLPKQVSGLPSWVPDWSSPILLPLTMWNVAGFRTFRASGEDCGRSELLKVTDKATCLTLSCRELDIVQDMSDVKMDYTHLGALYTFVRKVAHMLKGRINPYKAKEAVKISALRNITCDLEMPPKKTTPEVRRLPKEVAEDVWEILKQGNWHSTKGTPSQRKTWFEKEIGPVRRKTVLNFLQGLYDISSDKIPFVTSKGWLGMGPRCLQKGDLVIVVMGADVPYVIRRDEGYYRLVGEAYVHGIMDGQILKMGIPESKIELY